MPKTNKPSTASTSACKLSTHVPIPTTISDTKNKRRGTLALAKLKEGYIKYASNKGKDIKLTHKATL